MEKNERLSTRTDKQPWYEWLLDFSRACVETGAMGFEHHSRLYSAHFFERADQVELSEIGNPEN